jgi:dTDP-4-dehydrorhamnose 3,5-epimerase
MDDLIGPRLVEPVVHRDERGLFYESFNARAFERQIRQPATFVQDNYSLSYRDVLRGLHYQLPPAAQGKLVRVIRGVVFDVVVDLRVSSPSFGRWKGFELTAEEFTQLWIPIGFAHGFLALTEPAEVQYKTTDYYDSALERSLIWNDPDVGIDWPLHGRRPILSPKDASAPRLVDAEVFA